MGIKRTLRKVGDVVYGPIGGLVAPAMHLGTLVAASTVVPVKYAGKVKLGANCAMGTYLVGEIPYAVDKFKYLKKQKKIMERENRKLEREMSEYFQNQREMMEAIYADDYSAEEE